MLWSQSPPPYMYENMSYHLVPQADFLTAINGLLRAMSCHLNLDFCVDLQIYLSRQTQISTILSSTPRFTSSLHSQAYTIYHPNRRRNDTSDILAYTYPCSLILRHVHWS